jgi:hypothetical protein
MSEAAARGPGAPAAQGDPVEPTVALDATPSTGHTLPAGTRLHDYRIERVLGEGGFGIVYLATDVALERQVAVKEYLPSSIAARAGRSLAVRVKSPELAQTFALGLRSFVNEAKRGSTTRPCSRCISSGRPTAPPTWPCPTTRGRRSRRRSPGSGACPPNARFGPG